jgi:hypothetical protein
MFDSLAALSGKLAATGYFIGSGANSFFIVFQRAISCGQFFKMPATALFLQPSFRSQRPSFRYLHQSRGEKDAWLTSGHTKGNHAGPPETELWTGMNWFGQSGRKHRKRKNHLSRGRLLARIV